MAWTSMQHEEVQFGSGQMFGERQYWWWIENVLLHWKWHLMLERFVEVTPIMGGWVEHSGKLEAGDVDCETDTGVSGGRMCGHFDVKRVIGRTEIHMERVMRDKHGWDWIR